MKSTAAIIIDEFEDEKLHARKKSVLLNEIQAARNDPDPAKRRSRIRAALIQLRKLEKADYIPNPDSTAHYYGFRNRFMPME